MDKLLTKIGVILSFARYLIFSAYFSIVSRSSGNFLWRAE